MDYSNHTDKELVTALDYATIDPAVHAEIVKRFAAAANSGLSASQVEDLRHELNSIEGELHQIVSTTEDAIHAARQALKVLPDVS
jgi:hypothetical protein